MRGQCLQKPGSFHLQSFRAVGNPVLTPRMSARVVRVARLRGMMTKWRALPQFSAPVKEAARRRAPSAAVAKPGIDAEAASSRASGYSRSPSLSSPVSVSSVSSVRRGVGSGFGLHRRCISAAPIPLPNTARSGVDDDFTSSLADIGARVAVAPGFPITAPAGIRRHAVCIHPAARRRLNGQLPCLKAPTRRTSDHRSDAVPPAPVAFRRHHRRRKFTEAPWATAFDEQRLRHRALGPRPRRHPVSGSRPPSPSGSAPSAYGRCRASVRT